MGKMRSKWQQFDKNYFYVINGLLPVTAYSKFWFDFPIFLPLIFADDLIVQYFLAILSYYTWY